MQSPVKQCDKGVGDWGAPPIFFYCNANIIWELLGLSRAAIIAA